MSRNVVRGGSWNNNQRNARCAYRNRNNPDNSNNNNGFRIVVSTLFCVCQKCGAVDRAESLEVWQDVLRRRGFLKKNGGGTPWPRQITDLLMCASAS